MKKQFLILPVLCSSLFWACGDSSSATEPSNDPNPPASEILSSDSGMSPESGAQSSASADPSDPTVDPTVDPSVDPSNPTLDPSQPESSSGVEGPTENPNADPYAVGTDIDEPSYVPEGCEVKPLDNGRGNGVYCLDSLGTSSFKGTLFADPDADVAYDPANPDLTTFTSVEKVFKALQPDEKVVFVLRHAERNSSSGKTSHLTEFGIFSAQSVGQKIASEDPAYYAHSEYVRTRETLENIAKGRGETGFNHDAYGVLNGGWFIKNDSAFNAYAALSTDGNYVATTDWAFNGGYEDAFYDLDSRAKQFIDEFLVGVISKKARVSVVNTHDMFLAPLTIYASGRQIDLRYYENRSWITYLAGIAVVIGADGSVKVLPVKGLDSGKTT